MGPLLTNIFCISLTETFRAFGAEGHWFVALILIFRWGANPLLQGIKDNYNLNIVDLKVN